MDLVKKIGVKFYQVFDGLMDALQKQVSSPVGFFAAALLIGLAVDFLAGGTFGYIALFTATVTSLLSSVAAEVVKGGWILVIVVFLLLNYKK